MTPAMTALLTLCAAIIAVLALRRFFGFSAQRPIDYSAQTPRFDLRSNLAGPIECEGVIYGPTGRVTSRFVAKMHGTWEGNRGVLREHFTYDSGSEQLREWRLTIGADGRIIAEADDVVGAGTGEVSGPTVFLNYRIKLPASAGGHVLAVQDWMYLTQNGTIINRSQFRKFGFKVAELVATLRPAAATAPMLEAAE
jgi:hypothetical protein